MKIPRIFPSKKLRAMTARRSPMLGIPEDDYEQMSEPNMKLSRALLIVLVLHVVAVAGIIAFNTIKTHQVAPIPSAPASAAPVAEAETKTEMPPAALTVADSVAVKHDDPHATHSPAKLPTTAAEQKKDHPKPSDLPAADPAHTYVVAKGDNPVTIARRLKVPYDDLLAVNHIEDPHKLQIGQKLIIPAKAAKTRKPNE